LNREFHVARGWCVFKFTIQDLTPIKLLLEPRGRLPRTGSGHLSRRQSRSALLIRRPFPT
jgi:hypothetical protein